MTRPGEGHGGIFTSNNTAVSGRPLRLWSAGLASLPMNYYPTKSCIDFSGPQCPHLKQVVCATEDAMQMKWT